MGEAACNMTLEVVGPIVAFECTESDDLPIWTGKVTFEDLEAAKKAVAQYNGMDMVMGTQRIPFRVEQQTFDAWCLITDH
jgi:hypothetical protein